MAGYQLVFSNNAAGVLAVACTAAASTLQLPVAQAALFPQPAAGQAFYLQVQNGAAFESMLCTSNVGGVMTVQRAQEGTVAQPFAAGSVVTQRVTAAVLAAFLQSGPSVATIFAALAGSSTQTFDVAAAATPTNAVPLAQAQALFAAPPSPGQLAAPGDIKYSAVNSVPAGWLAADGSLVSRTTYATLFAAIGTTYGAGDGATTFQLPDGRGVFPRGFDNGRGYDGAAGGRVFGSYQGDAYAFHTHTATVTDVGHVHTITDTGHSHAMANVITSGSPLQIGSGSIYGHSATPNTNTATTGITINSATTGITVANGYSGAMLETVPKNIAFLCLIKT